MFPLIRDGKRYPGGIFSWLIKIQILIYFKKKYKYVYMKKTKSLILLD